MGKVSPTYMLSQIADKVLIFDGGVPYHKLGSRFGVSDTLGLCSDVDEGTINAQKPKSTMNSACLTNNKARWNTWIGSTWEGNGRVEWRVTW